MPPSVHSALHPPNPERCGPKRIGFDQLLDVYLTAYERVVAHGFAVEIDWQESQSLDRLSESELLRETAWVILSAGMRESVIRNLFAGIAEAFLDWQSAGAIDRRRRHCVRRGLSVFGHQRKIAAIADAAAIIATMGFEAFHERLRTDGLNELQKLPYIGPVTRFHLAKNLGTDVVKPDRHLVRMAHAAGFPEPEAMCRVVAEVTGDRVSTVDVVLWRFATLEPHYLDYLVPRPFDATSRPSQRVEGCAA